MKVPKGIYGMPPPMEGLASLPAVRKRSPSIRAPSSPHQPTAGGQSRGGRPLGSDDKSGRRTWTMTRRLKASRANNMALARAARQQQVQAAAVLAAMSEEIPAANIRAHPGAAAVQSKADEGGGGVQTKEAEALQQQPAPAASSCPLASFFAADQSAGPYRFFTSTGPSFGTMPHPEAQDQWPAPTAAGACPLLVGAHPAEACARTQPPILRQPPMTLEFPPATVSSPAPVSATAAPSGPGSAAAAAAAASAPPRVPPPLF